MQFPKQSKGFSESFMPSVLSFMANAFSTDKVSKNNNVTQSLLMIFGGFLTTRPIRFPVCLNISLKGTSFIHEVTIQKHVPVRV